MALTTTHYPIGLIFKHILTIRYSGKLILKGNNLDKVFFFEKGDLVFAESSMFDEKIGVILYLLGKLTEDQYNCISGLIHSPDQQVGHILVQNNFISPEDLQMATLFQQKKIAVQSFTVENAQIELVKEPAEEPPSRCVIPLPPVIAAGARKIIDTSFFKNRIQFMSPVTIQIPEPILHLLLRGEILLYEKLFRFRGLTNWEIISRLNLNPVDYWKKMILFILLEVIDFQPVKEDFNANQMIAELLEFKGKIDSGILSEHDILQVKKNAAAGEIEAAYQKLWEQFDPGRFGSAAAPEIRNIAHTAQLKIKQAYEALLRPSAKKDSGKPPAPYVDSKGIEMVELFDSLQESSRPKDSVSPGAGTKARPDAPKKGEDDALQRLITNAEALYKKGKYQDAMSMLKASLKNYPDNGDIYYLLGLCQSHLEFFQLDAEVNLKKAVELQPWNSDPVYALGLLYRSQDKKKQAAKCFERVMEMTASHSKAVRAIRELTKKKEEKHSLFSLLKKDLGKFKE